MIPKKGTTFRGLVSSGETIVIGDSIVSGGDGELDKAGTPVVVAAKAMEASGGSLAAATHLLMRAV
jgi:hypothetical protein